MTRERPDWNGTRTLTPDGNPATRDAPRANGAQTFPAKAMGTAGR
jgi:hypothetical protein